MYMSELVEERGLGIKGVETLTQILFKNIDSLRKRDIYLLSNRLTNYFFG